MPESGEHTFVEHSFTAVQIAAEIVDNDGEAHISASRSRACLVRLTITRRHRIARAMPNVEAHRARTIRDDCTPTHRALTDAMLG